MRLLLKTVAIICAFLALLMIAALTSLVTAEAPIVITPTLFPSDFSFLPALFGELAGPTATTTLPPPTRTASPTFTPTETTFPLLTDIPTTTPTSVPNNTPTLTNTPRPSDTPTSTATARPTNTPRPTKTPKPTAEATDTPEPTNTPKPTKTPRPTNTPRPTATDEPGGCDPSYPDFCIPPPPPDLDCGDIGRHNFTVLPPDPHHLDGDDDGVGCES